MGASGLKVLPEGVQRIAALLLRAGHRHAPVVLEDAAGTAQQAADALGVALGQIAKSIVFRRKPDDVAVLVVISGDQRVDEKKLLPLVCPDGERLGRADANFVKIKTGFSIGGVSPLAHASVTIVFIDESLFRFGEIWAAAGHPNAVVRLSPQELQRLTGAPVADLAASWGQSASALRRAMVLVRMRAATMTDSAEVPSPCISVCSMSADSGLCEGCFRSRDEIACWSQADAGQKRAVWKIIEQRMAMLSEEA